MRIVPLTPAIGAEVFEADLSRPFPAGLWGEIHRAFLRHQVLFFRKQARLAPEAQLSFGRMFGELHLHPAAPSLAGYPEIMVVNAGRDSTKHFGEGLAFRCFLRSRAAVVHNSADACAACPRAGILFASMYAAWEALSPAMQAFLPGLKGEHESEHYYQGRYAGVSDAGRIHPQAEHRVVTTHPETGRRVIFVNPMFTTRIRELNPDVAFWDNRCTLHLAIWDYWPHERRGHRVTIRGTRPRS